MAEEENFDQKTDAELVALSLKKSDYFLYLVKRYENRLCHYVMRLTGLGSEDSKDILQESLIKIYYNLNDFDSQLKFSSWVYRIVHNQAVSELRHRGRRPTIYLEDVDWNHLASDLDLVQEADNYLNAAVVRQVLAKMDEKYREILELRFLEGLDYQEISDVLQKPLGTVGTLINRAKKVFKERYQQKLRK